MKKILFIVEGLDVGGTELSLLKWLRHCDRSAFAPSVIALSDGILREELNRLNIPNIVFPKQRAFDLFFLYKLVKQIRQIAPDVIHCRNGIPTISYGVLAAKIARIPVVCSIHGRTHYLRQNFRTWIWFHIMRLSRMIVVVTQSIKDEIVRFGGITPSAIQVIHNGINTELSFPKTNLQLRQEFAFDGEDFIIGTVGSLRPIKGHKYLLAAMPDILRKIGNAQLALIGSGSEEHNLKQFANNLGIGNNIKFLGYKANAGKIMRMFDVFVLPSLSEGFPNVVLEAAMAKIPIIATRVGGIEEILQNGENGLLVRPADSNELTAQILKLATNKVLAQNLADNAFATVQAHFDINTTLRQYDALYNDLAT